VRNRGELAEGWYDPATLQKAVQETQPESRAQSQKSKAPAAPRRESPKQQELDNGDSDSDASIGPTLPGMEGRSRGSKMGPSIPNMQDLELKRGM
jgi:hypothetical protein